MALERRRSVCFVAMKWALRRWVTFHFDTYLALTRAFANTYWVYKPRNPYYTKQLFHRSCMSPLFLIPALFGLLVLSTQAQQVGQPQEDGSAAA